MTTRTETVSIELHGWHETEARPTEEVSQPQPQPSTPERDNVDAAEINYQQLHPVDGGFAAWRLLWTAFVFEALLWGARQILSFQCLG